VGEFVGEGWGSERARDNRSTRPSLYSQYMGVCGQEQGGGANVLSASSLSSSSSVMSTLTACEGTCFLFDPEPRRPHLASQIRSASVAPLNPLLYGWHGVGGFVGEEWGSEREWRARESERTGPLALRATRPHAVGFMGVCSQEQGGVECVVRFLLDELLQRHVNVHRLRGDMPLVSPRATLPPSGVPDQVCLSPPPQPRRQDNLIAASISEKYDCGDLRSDLLGKLPHICFGT